MIEALAAIVLGAILGTLASVLFVTFLQECFKGSERHYLEPLLTLLAVLSGGPILGQTFLSKVMTEPKLFQFLVIGEGIVFVPVALICLTVLLYDWIRRG